MPSAAARRMYEDQIPPFMSVYDIGGSDTIVHGDTVTLVDTTLADLRSRVPAPTKMPQPGIDVAMIPTTAVHKHHDGLLTHLSESTDSSPTTTLSTTDSSPLTESSASSSPDSPLHLIPLNNYPSTSFGCQSNFGAMHSIPESGTLDRPMTSPAPRRPRNTKGLSIQPPASLTAVSKTFATEPSSPSFIKPKIPAMRRKPSQLSLKTSTSDLGSKLSSEMPASPAMMPPILRRRALKHSTSSPQMAALRSPAFGPAGGMTFNRVLERNESGLSEVLRPMKSDSSMTSDSDSTPPQNDSPIKTQLADRSDLECFQDCANNEDKKSPGYPDGPTAIYDDQVFLYSEPTVDEASQFDVVINVAKEVKNPFDAPAPAPARFGSPTCPSPFPETAMTTASFATAFETQPYDDRPPPTPCTPRPTAASMPEYIHVPWDHNTDIASDLLRLCELIDSRTKEGKKVLVHCQQGASRSASLIIAYGLYKNPELSVNDAYYAAQAKSRWISPNMKLMYSLQDFHKQLSIKSSTSRPKAGRSPTKHRLTLSVDALDASKEPRTAPLPGEGERDGDEGIDRYSSRRSSTPASQIMSTGPSSAPLTCSWSNTVAERTCMSVGGLLSQSQPHQVEMTGESADTSSSLPSRQRQSNNTRTDERFQGSGLVGRDVVVSATFPADEVLMSPRVEAMTGKPLDGFSDVPGMRFLECPSTPAANLFSPRDALFPMNSLSLFGRVATFGRPRQSADPRSPPARGETPITRSIDDVL
ncbi:Tyrosine-protein phosphatase pmp1 [Ophiocordyceps camponoti-floridani]|uniref:protein-tyrosine-phosphatase n=1 Tax=Ophiocordyceps camponoti-floridani TaxID=2030778 RepID=A0A8H4Q1H7_9HYPO|nr:Tyrosine-protein phosphatase pmp1 [Ophiocordyceps camponoti-floridani]